MLNEYNVCRFKILISRDESFGISNNLDVVRRPPTNNQ